MEANLWKQFFPKSTLRKKLTIKMYTGCGFDLQAGHKKEAANECMNNWNNK